MKRAVYQKKEESGLDMTAMGVNKKWTLDRGLVYVDGFDEDKNARQSNQEPSRKKPLPFGDD